MNSTGPLLTSLRARADFLRLRKGRRYSTSNFTMQTAPAAEPAQPSDVRIGLTVTTKTGNAVERNRIKRRLRSAVKTGFPGLAKAGNDYVIIARRAVLSSKFDRLVVDIQQALDHLHRNRAKGRRTDPTG